MRTSRLSRGGSTAFPAPLGGNLDQALWINVRGQRRHTRGSPFYRGPLALMPQVHVGHWRPRETRTFVFAIWLPDGGTPSGPLSGDNVYQGSQAEVNFVWGARP